MKKTLLFVSLFVGSLNFAQDCTKIFISEYVEGWSNNKAIEIYNPTSQPVDLSGYVIARASNGAPMSAVTVANAIQLTGIIAPKDVYVAVLDKRNPQGTGQEAPVWDSLQVRADGFYAPDYNASNSFYWNGNDAIILFQGSIAGQPSSKTLVSITPTLTIVDIFGKVGENPGPDTGWSTIAPYNNGQGVIVTIDHSLIRKSTVLKGITDLTASFNPLAEFDSIPAVTYLFDDQGDTIKSSGGNPIKFGNWFSLGIHSCSCGGVSVNEISASKSAFSIFPNPSSNGVFNIESNAGIESVIVYNSLGQIIKNQKFDSENVSIKLTDLPGLYIVKIQTGNGIVSKRLIIK